jgi:hypothetical protein
LQPTDAFSYSPPIAFSLDPLTGLLDEPEQPITMLMGVGKAMAAVSRKLNCSRA